MADLPIERLTPAPSFSYVGLDVFRPWLVSARGTRGGVINNKRWPVLFTCLITRAIHIEVIEAMDTSYFINALLKFLALWGPVIQLCSDCSSNFWGHKMRFHLASKRWITVPLSPTLQLRAAIGSLMLLTPPMLVGTNDRSDRKNLGFNPCWLLQAQLLLKNTH